MTPAPGVLREACSVAAPSSAEPTPWLQGGSHALGEPMNPLEIIGIFRAWDESGCGLKLPIDPTLLKE